MGRLWIIVRREFRAIYPVWLFFFVAFTPVILWKAVLLHQFGVPFSALTRILVGTALVAKLFIVADHLSAMERYRGWPLVYPTAWKTWIYMVGAIIVQYIDALVGGLSEGHALGDASRAAIARMATPEFWAVQIWLVTLCTFFVAARELSRALGPGEARALFFGRRGPAPSV
jgi:hypothetical protein